MKCRRRGKGRDREVASFWIPDVRPGEAHVKPDGSGLPVFGNRSIRRRDARQKVAGNGAGVSS